MKAIKTKALVAGLALLGAGACADLNVPNPNDPGRDQVGEGGVDPGALIGGAFFNYYFAISHVNGVAMYLGTAAFEYSSMAANFGMVERSALPRQPLNNHPASAFASQDEFTWNRLYRALAGVNDGMQAITAGVEPEAGRDAAVAFGHLMRGLVYGTLAIGYDQAMILPDDFQYDTDLLPFEQGLSFAPASEVFAKAMQELELAIQAADGKTFTTPAGWWGNAGITAATLVNNAYAYRAYFRTMMPRSPAEAEAVNWSQVLADATAAQGHDVAVTLDGGTRYYRYDAYVMEWKGPWSKMPYQIYGMADTTGTYQEWMALPPANRLQITIASPDLRYPRGESAAEQVLPENRGTYFWHAQGGQANADRGTWRWSHYIDQRNAEGVQHPAWWGLGPGLYNEISSRMLDLMRAEAHYHLGNRGETADIVNVSRVGVGGLPAATATGTFHTAPNCVPRLPDGTCGDLLEALKWEWRMEVLTQGFATWFMNNRRWGDLAAGTFLHLPVPANELMSFGESVYTWGGIGRPGSAPVGTYGY